MGAKKGVTIDESSNIIHEIPTRSEYSAKQVKKLWYSKADIRKSRQEHQEEVMMEQVKVVVEKRLQDEGTPERLDEIMSWPPTQILMYLETPIVKQIKEIDRPKPQIEISDDDIMDLFSLDISKTLAKTDTPSKTETPEKTKVKKKKKKPVVSDSSSSDDSSSSSSSDDDSSASSSSSDGDSSSSSSSSDSDDDSSSSSSDSEKASTEKSKAKKSWFPKATIEKFEGEDDNEVIEVPGVIPQRVSIGSPRTETKGLGIKSPSRSPKNRKTALSPVRSTASTGEKSSSKGNKSSTSKPKQTEGDNDSIPPPPPLEHQDSGVSLGYESETEPLQKEEGEANSREGLEVDTAASTLAHKFKENVQNVQATVAIASYLKSHEEAAPEGSHLDAKYVPSDDSFDWESDDEDGGVAGDECPLCLGLVDASQPKKVILVAQMLCPKCMKEQEDVIGGSRLVIKHNPTAKETVSKSKKKSASSPKLSSKKGEEATSTKEKKKKKRTRKTALPPSKQKANKEDKGSEKKKRTTKSKKETVDDISSETKASTSSKDSEEASNGSKTKRKASKRRTAKKTKKSANGASSDLKLGSFAQLVQKRESLLEAAMEPDERLSSSNSKLLTARDSFEASELSATKTVEAAD